MLADSFTNVQSNRSLSFTNWTLTILLKLAAGANCIRACYNTAGLEKDQHALWKSCAPSPNKIFHIAPPAIADMPTVCQTYTYARFKSSAALKKFQKCEAVRLSSGTFNHLNNARVADSYWGFDGKPMMVDVC